METGVSIWLLSLSKYIFAPFDTRLRLYSGQVQKHSTTEGRIGYFIFRFPVSPVPVVPELVEWELVEERSPFTS